MIEVKRLPYESPLKEDGSINSSWEEVKQPDQLDLLHPLRTPGLRVAFGVPRIGEVAVGVHPTRIFIRVV